MKLSRRGFIQAAPAAVVAAPAVAAKIAQEIGGSTLSSKYAYEGTMVNQTAGYPTPEGSGNWAEEEIKRLIKNRAEVKAGFGELGDSIRYVEAQRIDGLRSVSPVSKARMAAEAERRRAMESELRWMDRRIAEIKKDNPVLAYLTEALT